MEKEGNLRAASFRIPHFCQEDQSHEQKRADYSTNKTASAALKKEIRLFLCLFFLCLLYKLFKLLPFLLFFVHRPYCCPPSRALLHNKYLHGSRTA